MALVIVPLSSLQPAPAPAQLAEPACPVTSAPPAEFP